jgi:hypothetical protein
MLSNELLLYIYSNYIILKYILSIILVLFSFTIYKWLNTNKLIYKSPYIYSLNSPFFIGLFKGLKGEFSRYINKR